MSEELKLEENDQLEFKDWLRLNLNSISWEGRYLDDFNQVWALIFRTDILVVDQFTMLDKITDSLMQGPVISWFKWLRAKLICYLFIHKNLSIADLSRASSLNNSEVSLILRDFFSSRFSHLEESINECFQTNNLSSINNNFKFSELKELADESVTIVGSRDDEVLKDLEITLYTDWKNLKGKLLNKLKQSDTKKREASDKRKLNQKIKFLRELVILFIVGGLLIFLIKVGNKTYEDYLVKRISLFSPDFFWLEKNLSFKDDNFLNKQKITMKSDELDKLEQIESKQVFEDFRKVTRYEVESDVVLTSVDQLPKDFEVAGLEQSNYEEKKKGGYRDSRYGRRRAYRIMMTSVNPDNTKERLVKILKKYKVEQMDTVKPGTKIPGGIYFNLAVPRTTLKEFLLRVSSFEREATILESRTRYGSKKNTDKVFIWIKSI